MEKTAEGDDGTAKRADVEKELLLRDVFPINPVTLEKAKTGMATSDLKEKMIGWIAGGCWELFKEKAKEIWLGYIGYSEKEGIVKVLGDVGYVKVSTFLTFMIKKGDDPCGSYAECGIALAMDPSIPIYLITTNLAKKELKKSLLQIVLASDGEVFESLPEYLRFIDEKYDLKRKVDKK